MCVVYLSEVCMKHLVTSRGVCVSEDSGQALSQRCAPRVISLFLERRKAKGRRRAGRSVYGVVLVPKSSAFIVQLSQFQERVAGRKARPRQRAHKVPAREASET